ncbi:AMP-binding protein [Flammeovirga sp. SubArs3]|uniref:AMP-binding protein n=1 Tax=Flammeovirga sp. SubArs3 TaxID=2995316 RepID=UPI00248ABA70|nr:AMP-binding protein [Flammeovirga sp. SubArs3]
MKDYQNLWVTLLSNKKYYKHKPLLTYKNQSYSFDLFLEKVRLLCNILLKQQEKVIAIQVSDPIHSLFLIVASLVAKKTYWMVNEEVIQSVNLNILKDVLNIDDQLYEHFINSNDDTELPLSVKANISGFHPFCWVNSSGSTSNHKITEYLYQGLLEDTLRQIRNNNITNNDRIDIVSSLNFSASLSSIFPVLYSGASLHLCDSTLDIIDFWRQEKITMTTLTPSLFRTLLKRRVTIDLPHLRFICLGGEEVFTSDILLFKKHFHKNQVLQLALASSETRMIGELKVKADTNDEYEEIKYQPIESKKWIILDQNDEVVTNEKEGRIAIQSHAIGHRYINSYDSFKQVDENTTLFISNDIGKIDKNDQLHFKGRSDNRIKIKGTFINLSEIEANLSLIESINDIAAIADSTHENLYLFVTTSSNGKDEIKRIIQASFPKLTYQLIILDKFPKTNSDKVDRKNLLKRVSSVEKVKDPYQNAWRKQFPLIDNFEGKHFFSDLGGDSLTSLSLISDLEEVIGKELSPQLIYLYPTFEKLKDALYDSNSFNLIQVTEYSSFKENILFIPSIHGSHEQYRFIQESLKEKYNIYLLQYPLKENPSDKQFYSFSMLIQQCVSFLDQSNISFKAFIGYSLSGYITYEIAHLIQQQPSVFIIDTPIYEKQSLLMKVMNDSLKTLKIIKKNFFNSSELVISYKRLKRRIKQQYFHTSSNDVSIQTIHDYFFSFYAELLHSKIKVSTTKFPLGTFIANDQSFFSNDIKATYQWEKYNQNLLFKKTLTGNHGSILNKENSLSIAATIIKELKEVPNHNNRIFETALTKELIIDSE